MDKNIPIDMIIVEPTVVDGKHIEAGTLLKKVDTELAMDLAGSGKARPATEELINEFKARKAAKLAAEKAAKEAEEIAAANALGNSEALANVIANAIATAVAAATGKPAQG
jgi:hypothetical protein